MTFNLEPESMTLKRLELALRKGDEALLKTAGYKLHEKLHAGFTFEYTSQLRQILGFIESENLDGEVYNLVSSTIKEILTTQSPQNSGIETKSYEVKTIYTDEPKSPSEGLTSGVCVPPPNSSFANSIFANTESTPTVNAGNNKSEDIFVYWEEKHQEIDPILLKEYSKIIASGAPMNEFSDKLGAILNILNSDLPNLNRILSTLASSKNNITFATSSLNSNLITRFENNGINYSTPSILENNLPDSWNFLPLFGQTNIFKCEQCSNRFLNNHSFIARCEKCSGAAFLQFGLDAAMMQNAIDKLLNSKIWVLINPPSTSSIVANMFSICYKNSKPNKVYLLTQDADKKAFYKNLLNGCEIKSDYTTDESFCEEFMRIGVYS